jgi:hypothetical protein
MKRWAPAVLIALALMTLWPETAPAEVRVQVYIAAGGVAAGLSVLVFFSLRSVGFNGGEKATAFSPALLVADADGWTVGIPMLRLTPDVGGGQLSPHVTLFHYAF